ncbi:Protein IMPACT-B [Armadillidium vulgare]|nr:Protein IMPACT-B [Armadillidium vulgare]
MDTAITEDNFSKQKDEIEALSSIYGTDFHSEDSNLNSYSVEINENEEAVLEFSFPPEYPSSAPPTYSLSAPWLKGLKRKTVDSYLEEIYLENIGESVIYLWIERIRQFITEQAKDFENEVSEDVYHEGKVGNDEIVDRISDLSMKTCKEQEDIICPEIFSGEIIADRKSYFQPHLAEVHSVEEVKRVLKELYKNKKIANATHNMYAYRFRKKDSNSLFQDCDDDGETNAGGRMLHLLQILEAENALVVVSRWYGGIQLGPDRFKHINNAARQILSACGYVKDKEDKKKKSKKK